MIESNTPAVKTGIVQVFLLLLPQRLPHFPCPSFYDSNSGTRRAFEQGVEAVSNYHHGALRSLLTQLFGPFVEEIELLDLFALLNNADELAEKKGKLLIVWDCDVTQPRVKKLGSRLHGKSWDGLTLEIKVVTVSENERLSFQTESLESYVAEPLPLTTDA